MTKVKKLEEVKINFPSISERRIPADPMVRYSREQYLPYKFSMQKTGDGLFQLEHKVERLVPLDNDTEIIFISIPVWASCNCRKWDPVTQRKDQNTICYSPDNRTYSNKGFQCGKETCPLKRDDNFRKSLAKEAHLLVRDATDPDKWYLSRFTSVLDNVKDLMDIRNRVHNEMSKYGRIGSQAIVRISITKVEEYGNPVCRYNKKFEITGIIDDKSYIELGDYYKEIEAMTDASHDKTVERNIKLHADKKEEAKILGMALKDFMNLEAAKIKGAPLVTEEIVAPKEEVKVEPPVEPTAVVEEPIKKEIKKKAVKKDNMPF